MLRRLPSAGADAKLRLLLLPMRNIVPYRMTHCRRCGRDQSAAPGTRPVLIKLFTMRTHIDGYSFSTLFYLPDGDDLLAAGTYDENRLGFGTPLTTQAPNTVSAFETPVDPQMQRRGRSATQPGALSDNTRCSDLRPILVESTEWQQAALSHLGRLGRSA